jgi:uncharacterized protein (DUF1015 family)
MPRLKPLSAITYPQGDLSALIAPPYDVLDEGPKQALLRINLHNIVAVDLPVTPPKTVGPDAAYDAAGDLFRRWRTQGVLRAQAEPAVFAYEQVYEVNGQILRRRGLFACLGLEPFNRKGGGIFRHEHTIRGGIDDRSKLMEATKAQLSPVFGIFSDPDGWVAGRLANAFDGREPDLFGTTAHDAVEHRCWRVTDPQTHQDLAQFFEAKDVFIADGHHRYTTALNYHHAHPEQPEAAFGLFVLVAAEDPGMIVLPTHRVICGMQAFSMARLITELEDRDDVTLVESLHGPDQLPTLLAALPGMGHHAMGLYDPATGRTYVLSANDADPLARWCPQRPAVWRTLDVAVLHELLIDRLLRPSFGGQAISFKYTADLQEMRRLSDAERGRLGVIVQPTRLESVMAVSLADEVMPPKSTFFYPKLATGVVIHPLD